MYGPGVGRLQSRSALQATAILTRTGFVRKFSNFPGSFIIRRPQTFSTVLR